jgi:hypothetical protein
VEAILTLEDFAPAVGEAFVADAAGEAPVELRLVEARSLGDEPFGERRPFALLFRGPAATLLRQGTYAVTHARLGEQPVFIVPIARTADGTDYEAIFT